MTFYINGIINNAGNKQNPQAACIDAIMYDQRHEPLYSRKERKEGAKLYRTVKAVFPNSRVYHTYRKNFIAVKVEHPKSADVFTEAACNLFIDTRGRGYSVMRTSKGIIWRIMRNAGKWNQEQATVKELFGLE